MNIKPIDIVIPAYNGEEFIESAIISVMRQTVSPAKLIVVNDGSTDGTATKVKQIFSQQSHLPIRLVLCEQENRGLSAARNAGIRESDSEFIAFLDADDEWLPNKLEKQYQVFNESEFKNLGVVFCNFELIDIYG